MTTVFSPEIVRQVATLIPVLLAAWWLLRGLGWLWRRTLWAEGQALLEEVALGLDGEIEPVWAGWRVRTQRGELRVSGGLRGIRTLVRPAGGEGQVSAGWLPAAEILSTLRR